MHDGFHRGANVFPLFGLFVPFQIAVLTSPFTSPHCYLNSKKESLPSILDWHLTRLWLHANRENRGLRGLLLTGFHVFHLISI